tara:strand:- start:226 stop:1251 length:1026 start_codon:yes stop_codon:yes gene_type:complete
MGHDERIAVTGGIAEIIHGRLPLAAGLRAIASEIPSRRARRAMITISARVEQGIPVDEAVNGQDIIIPSHLRTLLRAGIKTGRIAELLEHYLHFARSGLDTRRRNTAALFYPALLLLTALMVIGALLNQVVPSFADIFQGFQIEIPAFTQLLLWIADFVQGWRLSILPLGLLAAAVTWFVFGRVAGPLQRKWLYHIPVVGRMVRLGAASRFCHLLAIGIDHGIPTSQALRLAGDGSGDAYIGRATDRMAEEITQGTPLSQSANTHRMVPEITHVFQWQTRDNAFAEILRATGDICAAQSRVQSGLAGVLIEPLTIIGIATAVGTIFVALILPLLNLFNMFL